jgi:hypothetical protein
MVDGYFLFAKWKAIYFYRYFFILIVYGFNGYLLLFQNQGFESIVLLFLLSILAAVPFKKGLFVVAHLAGVYS